MQKCMLISLLSVVMVSTQASERKETFLVQQQNVQQPARLIIVRGEIKDDREEPLPGVSVVYETTGRGVVSDMNGRYEIKVPAGKESKLRFSFVGMKSQTVIVNNRPEINVQLMPNTIAINEVVIQGAYGTQQKRSDLVGSAYQITSEKIANLPAMRVDKILDGLLPGVTVNTNIDSPTSTRPRYNLRVRGDASMSASNEPLWVVDGTPIYTGERTNQIPGMSYTISPHSFVNMDDIESITVLKDAASTSIYGADGANGVILVTTKSGTAGPAKIDVGATFGTAKINKSTLFKTLNAEQWLLLAKESYKNANMDPRLFPYQDNEMNAFSMTDTDWTDVYYGVGNTLMANLSIQGGAAKSKYYISGGYYQNKSTVDGNLQQRFSARVNNTLQLHKKFSANINLSLSYNINNLFNPGTDYYKSLPVISPYNADGTFRLYNTVVDGISETGEYRWKVNRFINRLAEKEENDNRQRTFQSVSNVSLKYEILPCLTATSQVGIDFQSSYEDMYDARTNWSGMSIKDGPYGYSTRGHGNYLLWTNVDRLNYNQAFGKHLVSGVGGFEISSKEYNLVSATGSSFVNDFIKEIAYAVNQDGSSSARITRSMSFFLQGNYSYDQRYYLSITGRRDGNSSFGKDVRWGDFGAVGASWNIHNEHFFQSEWVNVLKLKASYGTNGNSRLGSQEAQGTYSYNESDRYGNEPGGAMSASPNSKLSWETTYMANMGIRVRAFNRVDVEVEVYRNKTVDLLSQLDVSRTTGDLRVYRNVGSIRNQGIEVTVNSDNLVGPVFWTTELNMSHNSNKLLELYNGIEKVMGEKIWREGYDINTFYLVRWAGVDPRDGAPMWYDKNGNITRTYNYENRVPVKKSSPKLIGSLTNNVSWEGWSLRVMLNYQLGGYGFSSFGRGSSSDGLNIMSENQSVNQLDRWQKPGDLALAPKPVWGISTQSAMNSTRFLYNCTNLRLQNITLGYDLPDQWMEKCGIKSCRINLIGDNLGVWTPYDKSNRNSYRNCMSGYPLERTFSLGVNLNF